MINIHLYPSAFLNESRILREAGSLARLKLFDQIDLVGLGGPSLLKTENVRQDVQIVRIGHPRGKGAVGKLTRTALWSWLVFHLYSEKPVGCVNCHSVATLPLGVLLCRATGAKLVYDAHELETETNGLSGPRKLITKYVERKLIKKADHCIFVGRAIEQWYENEYDLHNTTVLYNCPPRRQTVPSEHFREAFAIVSGIPIFLYQGFIGEGRGLRNLMEAFSTLAGHAVLVVMGYGPLVGLVTEESKRNSNIHYHPAVSPERLLDYTASADFGLSVIEPTSLSYEYCMPNKLFEYVMAGKPVLVSPTREQSHFVDTYQVGEVARDTSSTAIREAVFCLLKRDPQALHSALSRAAEEYCWEGQEKKLESIYVDSLGISASRKNSQHQPEAQSDFCH